MTLHCSSYAFFLIYIMKQIDYYKILGVDRTASTEDVKHAYYKLARKYHPDYTDDKIKSVDKFLLINTAYQVLSDIEKRIKHNIDLDNYEIIKSQAKIELNRRKSNN